MDRPKCRKCGAELSGQIRMNHTTCPNCGKRWRLNADNTAIYTQVLTVQNVRHGTKATIRGGNANK